MWLENAAVTMTPEQWEHTLRTMNEGSLLAQEISQKSAIHAIEFLLRQGCTEANARAILDSLKKFAAQISAECRRRKLPTVDHPSGH